GRLLHEVLAELQKQDQRLFVLELAVAATWGRPPAAFPAAENRGAPRISVAQWKSSRDAFRGASVPARYEGVVEMPERRHVWLTALLRDTVVAQCEVDPDQDEAKMTFDPARLLPQRCNVRLQVVDAETRAPIAGATVSLNDAQGWGPGNSEKTDAEGRAELKQLLPGLL